VLALQESYLQGVSTHNMRRITEKLCGIEFSKDQVFRMVKALDEELDPWRNRSIEQTYPTWSLMPAMNTCVRISMLKAGKLFDFPIAIPDKRYRRSMFNS